MLSANYILGHAQSRQRSRVEPRRCFLLEFDEPSVISKAIIAKPIDEEIRAAFLWNECYGNTRLSRGSAPIVGGKTSHQGQ